jgi:hypothetical protein
MIHKNDEPNLGKCVKKQEKSAELSKMLVATAQRQL